MITYTGYKLKVIFIIFLFLGYHVIAYTEMDQDREFCYPGSPENNTTPTTLCYNFGTTIISDINNNMPGTILPKKNWKIGLYKAYRNSASDYEVCFNGVSGVDPSDTSGIQQGGDIFVPVTHEVSISTHVKLYNRNGTQTDKTVPFYSYNTNYPTGRSKPSSWSSGTEGYIRIKLDRKIISDISLNNVLLASLYASQRRTEHGPVPLFNTWISNLDIQVPQGCIINGGTSFTVNMPDVWASELNRTGAGAKPAGVTPVATTIPIDYMNKDTDTVMTLVFDGNISATRDTNRKRSIIQTQDNPDVGIMIMDSQQSSVNSSALATSVGVPFRLVENQTASAQTADVTFLTLPVGATGRVPAAGRYNTLAILRVEYQQFLSQYRIGLAITARQNAVIGMNRM